MMYASELWLAKLTEARKLLNESVGAHVYVWVRLLMVMILPTPSFLSRPDSKSMLVHA